MSDEEAFVDEQMIKATLLIVDDESMLLEMMTEKFRRLSYKVYSASSGAEALQILAGGKIDVLVTDFNMPRMNGGELIKKALSIDPMLQSIVVTGYSDLTAAVDVMGAGAFNYLEKPINFNELESTIQKCLTKRRKLQDTQDKNQQLSEYREHLEELVKQRTLALTETNRILKLELEERKRLEDSLREAKLIAENASKAKSEFLANMSHEIRTPMTSAIGLLNLVLDTELLPKQKTYLEMARVSTVAMHNLLNDILDFSKIEAGKLTLELISFDPRKIINSVIDIQRLQAEEKGIDLSSFVENDVPATVIGDPNRLRQILLNLVSNALKFTLYGAVVIKCAMIEEPTEEPLSHANKYKILRFSVQDTGTGIEKDKIECIFEAFTQADSSTTRKFGGVGLGLNICSKLVTMMGGHISVESVQHHGSTFNFSCKFGVPENTGDEEQRHQLETAPYVRESTNEKATTILLVEDNPSNRWVFRELLQKQGYQVVNVSNGVAALEEIENRYFDLMLLDLQLPQMNGYEVVHQIKINTHQVSPERGQHLPIIAMTGFAGENEKQRCLAAGMDDFIAKPFTTEQLITKIRKVIGERTLSQANRIEQAEINEKTSRNIPLLKREIFNEGDALQKASGDRGKMVERLQTFLQNAPLSIAVLRDASLAGDKITLEQIVHGLKEAALEAGATTLADELFSLLMNLRNNQAINESEIDILVSEFAYFDNDIKMRTILGE